MKKITFGIVAYNIEKYIEDCLETVCGQEGDDIEILIVNDCSSDSTGEICRRYKEKDPRIVLIDKDKNEGVSKARNDIIDNAKGQWLYYIDGDDYIDFNLAKAFKEVADEQYDIIYFGNENIAQSQHPERKKYVSGNLTPVPVEHFQYFPERIITSSAFSDLSDIYKGFKPANVWGRFYNMNFIRCADLHFIDQKKGQDVLFSSMLYNRVKTGAVCDFVGYYYRLNDGSICLRYNSDGPEVIEALCLKIKKVIETEYKNSATLNEKYYSQTLPYQFIQLLKCSLLNENNPKSYKEQKADFFECVNSELMKDAIKNYSLTKNEKGFGPKDITILFFTKMKWFYPLYKIKKLIIR